MKITKKTLKSGMREIIRELDGVMEYGVLFNGGYMIGFNHNGYHSVKLPCYAPDSFLLPMKVIIQILKFPGSTLTIKRSEKNMLVRTDGMSEEYIYNFERDKDTNEEINEDECENEEACEDTKDEPVNKRMRRRGIPGAVQRNRPIKIVRNRR